MDSRAFRRAVSRSLALAIGLGACGSDSPDSAGPIPRADVAPSLGLTLKVAADGRPGYDIAATFAPGRDAEGRSRGVVNDTLYLDDLAIPAARRAGTDTLFYSRIVALPPATGRATVRVRGPQIAGEGAAQLDLPLPRHAAEVTLPVGTDLGLSVTPPPAVASVAIVARDWRVALQRACAGSEYVAFWGPGAPTYHHEIGWSMVASMPRDSLAACASSTYDFAGRDGPYRVVGTVGARIRWFIRIAG